MNEPHFDDRRVLQRAQQVVPLARIRARRLLLLSGAFVIAMLLGAGSALLAVRIKQRNQLTQISTEAAPEMSAPAETAAAVPVESPEPTPEAVVTEEAPPPVKHVTKQEPAVAHRPRMVGARSDEVQPTEEEQLNQIREAVLYDQWQERRMRRAARRERLRNRDLSHVDEIFEGRRRDRP